MLLITLSASFGNNGCKGGLMDNAFRYLESKEDETEQDYRYHAQVRMGKVHTVLV